MRAAVPTATAMSRSTGPRPAATRHEPRPTGIRRSWHVLCMVLCVPACFYVKPIRQPVPNLPPRIAFPTADPETAVIRQGEVRFRVGAEDPEGQPLYVEWPDLVALDDVRYERFSSGEIVIEQATVSEPSVLEGRIVRALVYDGRAANVVTVRWQVEAP